MMTIGAGVRRPRRKAAIIIACGILAACHETVGEREESLGHQLHRLTVDIAGEPSADVRLARAADAVCPAGYARESDEAMPPGGQPSYRVWLVRCK
ncbi:MAG TPA: hypothetical protein VKQ29_08595 [Aliidongia sp.]|nr:hypothetical protein [Aliidongia sp.]